MESAIGIKIGVSKNVNKRLQQIKMYASDAQIKKVIPYAGEYEKKIHKKFKSLNIKGNQTIGTEWFIKNDDLLSWISELDSVGDLVTIFGSKRGKGIVAQLSLFQFNPN